jgi:hydrogenase maturation protease
MAFQKTLILGLGNTILGDDGVGICVAREIRNNWAGDPLVEIIEASLGGMVLLDLITGFDRVIVVDAIMTNATIELGKRIGYKMPATVRIYAVKIEENTVFTEKLTPAVGAVVPALAGRLIDELKKQG